jgi:hypothetical protein
MLRTTVPIRHISNILIVLCAPNVPLLVVNNCLGVLIFNQHARLLLSLPGLLLLAKAPLFASLDEIIDAPIHHHDMPMACTNIPISCLSVPAMLLSALVSTRYIFHIFLNFPSLNSVTRGMDFAILKLVVWQINWHDQYRYRTSPVLCHAPDGY